MFLRTGKGDDLRRLGKRLVARCRFLEGEFQELLERAQESGSLSLSDQRRLVLHSKEITAFAAGWGEVARLHRAIEELGDEIKNALD